MMAVHGFLATNTLHKRNLSPDRMMDFFSSLFINPFHQRRIKKKEAVVIFSALILFFISSAFIIFVNMGGEFIPTIRRRRFCSGNKS